MNRCISTRSRYQLEYQQAQDIMDGRPPRPGHDCIALADRPRLQRNLQVLAWVAAHLRAGRLQVCSHHMDQFCCLFNSDVQKIVLELELVSAFGSRNAKGMLAVMLQSQLWRP